MAQAGELEEMVRASLGSNTIEWTHNIQICDMIEARPPLASHLMRLLQKKLSGESPVPVLLGLSLLEIVAKNCGLPALAYVDEALADALVGLVKKREGFQYSLGRNLFKTFGSTASSYGIDEGQKELWLQASHKVREMLQLWTDAFMLQEAHLQPIFRAYKKLRSQGYTFPDKQKGASADICLMKGAEDSPAFLAAGYEVSSASTRPAEEPRARANSNGSNADREPPDSVAAAVAAIDRQDAETLQRHGSAASAASSAATSAAVPPPPRINLTPAAVEATRDSCRELRELRTDPSANADRIAELELRASSAREEAIKQIDRQLQGTGSTSETHLEALMLLLDDLNEVLPPRPEDEQSSSAAAAASPPAPAQEVDLLGIGGDSDAGPSADAESAPLPPPPSEAPPDREQQEKYDEILARYLQERENAAFASYDEDAALALRLSMEDNGHDMYAAHRAALQQPMHSMVSCGRCGAVNQLTPPSHGGSGLFVCYACGVTQAVPGGPRDPNAQRHMRSSGYEARSAPVPTRHAPPAKVINTGPSELLIGGGSAASAAAETTGYQPPAVSSIASEGQSFEGGQGSQALLGAPPKSSKAWKMSAMPSVSLPSMSSMMPSGTSSSSAVKTLGEGNPTSSEYISMDDEEEGNALVGGPPRAAKSSGSMTSGLVKGFNTFFKSKGGSDEQREGLLGRVQVDEEWELIQPGNGQRPYWHNSVTQASQWQPPDVVTSSTGLLG